MTLTSVGAANNYYPVPTVGQYTNPYLPATTTPPVVGDTGSFGSDFSSIGRMVAHAAGGGFASYKLGGQMAQNIKTMFGKPPAPPAGVEVARSFGGNFMTGLKGVATTSLKGAGLSALVSAGVSAVTNGVGVATGKQDGSTAVSNVLSDTIGGAVGGLGAVTLGGLGNLALGAFGIAGLPLTIATVGLGAVGGVLAGKLLDSSGAVQSLQSKFNGQ